MTPKGMVSIWISSSGISMEELINIKFIKTVISFCASDTHVSLTEGRAQRSVSIYASYP